MCVMHCHVFGTDVRSHQQVYLFDVYADPKNDRKVIEQYVRDMGFVKPRVKTGGVVGE